MQFSPLRSAFWTLSASIGLSISLLAISSISSFTHTPPPASLSTGDHSQSTTLTQTPQLIVDDGEPLYSNGDHSDWPPDGAGGLPDQIDNDPAPGTAEIASSGDSGVLVAPLVPTPVDIPDPPRIPVSVVSHPESFPLAIGLEEALQPASGRSGFFELPPPPELGVETTEHTDPSQTQTSTAVEKLIARLQQRFDGLDNEFNGLHVEFDNLHNQFAAELATVQSSHNDVREAISNLAEVTAQRDQIPPPLEFDMTMLLMPLRGAARHGALALIARESPEASLSIGPEIADGTRWATSRTDADTLDVWLRNRAQARFERHSELHVEQQSQFEIDLSQPIGPTMIQARGSRIQERIIALPWDGPLTMRASARPSGPINVDLQVRTSGLTGADDRWRQATLTREGTLILTVVLDEIYRPINGDSSGGIESASNRAAPPRRSSTTEIIVLLQPRVLTAPAPLPPISSLEQAPLPPGE